MIRPRLIIFNDFFYPAYKAGGPIQSLVNLIVHLNERYDIYVITSAYDLNDTHPMEGVRMNEWMDIFLPSANVPVKVWYSDNNKGVGRTIKNTLKYIRPTAIYINGMFSYGFVILPLLLNLKIKTVICPRGMIQEGALAGKYLKKKIYLTALKMSGLLNNIWWHATSEIEYGDIKKIFGENAKTVLAGNIPKRHLDKISIPDKMEGRLRLVYLSLITAKKNLLQSIESVILSKSDITLDIYGPVKDISYWEKCEQAIKRSEGKIVYRGDVIPDNVQATFSKYDASLFLTKAENFGHALYESLSVGRPIITSFFTPWKDLEKKKAGWNVDIDNITDIVNTLDMAAALDQHSFAEFCVNAHELSKEYYNEGFRIADYKTLF